MLKRLNLASRAAAAAVHLLVSLCVALLAGALVFGLWYPGDYRLLSGGRSLFFLVVTVDVILGPLLTFAVYNLEKGWPHLRRDLAIIAVIQLAGLTYGMHTVYVVRPVAMVFEVDRFRVVTASDVYLPELPMAPAEYRSLPVTGPWLLSTRSSEAGDDHSRAIMLALEGFDIGQRPTFWRPYDEGRGAALARARPIELLLKKYPDRAAQFNTSLSEVLLPSSEARFLPLVARGDWVAVLDAKGDIATVLPADGFF